MSQAQSPLVEDFPLVSLQPVAVDFMDNRLPNYDPAFLSANQQTRYDAAAERFVPSGPSLTHTRPSPPCPPSPRPVVPVMEKLTFWNQIFPKAMESLKTQHPVEPKVLVESGFSIRLQKSWDGINHKVQEAQERFKNDDGVRGKIKKATRKMADNAHYAEGVVAFVPEFEYSSPVLALVKVLLKAAKTASMLRQKLAGSLEALEQKFGDIETYVTIFPDDENILKASVHLVAVTFHGVENLIGYYLKSRFSRGFSATVSGDDYQKDLVRSLEQIEASSEQLIHQAQNSDMNTNKQTQDAVHQGFEHQSAAAEAYHMEAMQSSQQFAAYHQDTIRELFNEYKANIEFTISMLGIGLQAQIRAASPAYMVLPPQRMELGRDDITRLLQVPDGVEKNDMEHVFGSQSRLSRIDCQRAGQLVTLTPFQMWMTHPSSAELLVHGDLQGQLYVSGVTLFCATFCQTIAALPPAASSSVISFYCGRHLRHDERPLGGQGMLRCLVAQVLGILVQRHGPGVSIELERTLDPDGIRAGDIVQLGQLLLRLVGLLGGGGGGGVGGGAGSSSVATLFCVIDGVVYYERDQFWPETERALDFLLTMARMDPWQQLGGCIFKLLVTSPSPTRKIRYMVPQERILTMSHNTIPATWQNFSRQALARRLGNCHGL